MPEPFATAGADYLEQLLRAAIGVPAAPADPAGGRVVARLMMTLGKRGEDERLETYLACSPGTVSVYQVTCYDEAGRPASQVMNLAAGPAIRAAAGLERARAEATVEVVARDAGGNERCVLVARGTEAVYQFPVVREAPPTSPGREAGQRPPAREAGQRRPAREATQSPPAREAARRWGPDPRDAQWVAVSERLDSLPTTDEVVTALREGLGGITCDLRERLGSVPTTDELVDALRDLLGGMTLELDATAIEDLFHAALDDLPHVAAHAAAATAAVVTPTATPAVDDVIAPETEEVVAESEPIVHATAANDSAYVVNINANVVTDLVGESSPPQLRHGNPGRPNAVIGLARIADRQSADRAVEDVVAIGAAPSRRD